MKKMRWLTLLLALTLVIGSFAGCARIPDDNGESDNNDIDSSEVQGDILARTEKSDVIYVVRETIKGLDGKKSITIAEKFLLQTVQGIVAQRKAEIYIGTASDKFLKHAKIKYNITLDDGKYLYTVDAEGNEQKTESTTTWLNSLGDLVNHYAEAGDIKGYVKIKLDSNKFNELKNQSNQACTYAGAYQYVAVSDKLEASFNEHCSAVTLGKDISATEITQIEVYKECEEMLSKDVLIMQAANRLENLREYGISQKAGFYFYNESDPVADRDYVYTSLNTMANAYGWEQIDQTEDGIKIGMTEDPSVDFASKRDVNVFAADWCKNLSVWMSMPIEKAEQKDYKKLSEEEEQKHYVTLLYSDGDNIQWTTGGGFINDFYLGTKPEKKEMPFGWTLTPSMAEVAPSMLSYIYENMLDTEQFVGSVSGYAYSHPANFSEEGLKQFSKNTAAMMGKADMDLLAMKGVNEKVMDSFANEEEIRGGFVMYGADSGKGGNIYWSNGKPFIHDRYILWADRGAQNDPIQVAKRISQIRELSQDKTKSSCYTFIQVHCWSYKYAAIQKDFYNNLDKENIKVVTPGEMIDLVVANVQGENGKYTK